MSRRALGERGAVLVMALLVGILLVGLVYHLSGVGRAALEQQIMQDAADASAFSAAAVNARGMNILALLNLIMVAVLTILVALRLVEALVTVALAAVSVCCAVPGYGTLCCGLEAPLAAAEEEVTAIADEYQEIAVELLKGLHSAAEAVNEIVPLIALAEGASLAAKAPYSPPARFGVVYPFYNGLPTKEGSFDELCRRAGENVATPMQYTMPSKEMGELLTEILGDFIGELTETFSSYFCGEDGGGDSSQAEETETITAYDQEVEVEIEGKPIAESEEEKQEMAPRVLDAERYRDESRMTAVLVGESTAATRIKGVSIASGNNQTNRQSGTRFSFAAATYYSQDKDAESLWHMRWLSRLVRFNFDVRTGGGGQSSVPGAEVQDNNRKGEELLEEARGALVGAMGGGTDVDDLFLH